MALVVIAVITTLVWAASPAFAGQEALLSSVVSNPAPWLSLEANSEQRQPVYLGVSPRQLALGHERAVYPQLYEFLQDLGHKQALAIRKALGGRSDELVEFEAWPVQDDAGQLTWAFARYRRAADPKWRWLDEGELKLKGYSTKLPQPMLPVTKNTWNQKDLHELFADIFELDLYTKPLFGDSVWMRPGTDEIVGAWLPTEQLASFRRSIELNDSLLFARVIAQPARFNDQPITFVLRVNNNKVEFPAGIRWIRERPVLGVELPAQAGGREGWFTDFSGSYEEDVRVLSGDKVAVFPGNRRRVMFNRKNNADPHNQLELLVDYLTERYEHLGLKTVRQRFLWRGIWHSNLIAVIPGRLTGRANKPILMADHIDTAFCEDAFNRTAKYGKGGERVSAPGADDNVTATAALLRAAELFKATQPDHDIWLVHLTGEEFPADDLGARKLISHLLAAKKDIGGLVLMDMIGYRKRSDRVFQINAADSDESLKIALIARDSAQTFAKGFQPVVRKRFDARSYLYNTDGIIFANAGFPVILLNEHINALENLNRRHYHETTDTVQQLDFGYAVAITRVAIETVARLAGLR